MNPILKPYVSMADMLVKTFGAGCEVVLHDLNDPEHSVAYVAGNVTQREIEQNFDHLITDVMLSENLADDYVANYYFEAKGKLIRSSTQLIFDAERRLVGALCINIDTTPITAQIAYLNECLPNFPLPAAMTTSGEAKELPLSEMVEELMQKILNGQSPDAMSRDEKIEKIRFMEEKGIFLMKNKTF